MPTGSCDCCDQPLGGPGTIVFESTGLQRVFKCGMLRTSVSDENVTGTDPNDFHRVWTRTWECVHAPELNAHCDPGIRFDEVYTYAGPDFRYNDDPPSTCPFPDPVSEYDPCGDGVPVYCGRGIYQSVVTETMATDAEMDAELVNLLSGDILWLGPFSFAESTRDTFATTVTMNGGQNYVVNTARNAQKIRWKLQHSPTATCYLKVWFVRTTRPKGGTGSTDVIEELPPYEWSPTPGDPGDLCIADPLKAWFDADNAISSSTTEEPLMSFDGQSTVIIKKWSMIPGYVPDDPLNIAYNFGGTRPIPDLNPNGFPKP